MSEEEKEKEEEVKEEDQVTLILNELKGFQGILDSKDVKMSKKSLRAWAGHINFTITTLIEEFQKVKDIINSTISKEIKNDDTKKPKKQNLYI